MTIGNISINTEKMTAYGTGDVMLDTSEIHEYLEHHGFKCSDVDIYKDKVCNYLNWNCKINKSTNKI